MVNQVRILVGRWSMKISHSANPRNRSRRNSRSPATGSVIAGAEATAALLSLRGVPATGSAMDDIWHRWFSLYACTVRGKIISAHNLHTRYANRYGAGPRAGAL